MLAWLGSCQSDKCPGTEARGVRTGKRPVTSGVTTYHCTTTFEAAGHEASQADDVKNVVLNASPNAAECSKSFYLN